MDFLAVVSLGTFPTPTPTAKHRAGQFAIYGLLTGSSGAPDLSGDHKSFLYRLGMHPTMA